MFRAMQNTFHQYIHYHSKFGAFKINLMFLKEVSYPDQGCIYFIKILYKLFTILMCIKMLFIPVMAKVNF